jgi:hypothetical protein
MPQTVGCRKALVRKGKSREKCRDSAVFYYYVSGSSKYILDAHPKNQKENLTDAEKNDLKNLAQVIEREESR